MSQISALVAFVILTFAFATAHSAVQVIEVDPALTGRGIRTIQGRHRVVTDASAVENGKLLITIGGTSSNPSDFSYVHSLAAALGYRSLGIDYPNAVVPTVCQSRPERDCFDNYRKEIIIGKSVSPYVQVNDVNSIVNRIEALIAHLRKSDEASWQGFALSDGSIDWSKVVLVGHSQGAGHVAFLAKLFKVSAVVMTGGPFDKSGSGLASWLSLAGATSTTRYSAFLHKQDFFGSDLQLEVVRALLENSNAEVVDIDGGFNASIRAQILMTNRPAADPHNSFATSEFENVWRALLQRF